MRGLAEGVIAVCRGQTLVPASHDHRHGGRGTQVAFVSSHAQLGGSERLLEALLGGLDEGWVGPIVSLQDGPFVARLRSQGRRVGVLPTSHRLPGLVASAWRLRGLLRGTAVDVIHANGVKAAVVAVLATAFTRHPVVWVKHDFSWDARIGRRLARHCRLVVGVSEAVVAPLVGLPNVRIVHPGIPPQAVDRDRARTALLEAMDSSEPVSAVALVGRLHPVKGQLELVEALPLLAAATPQVKAVLIGPDDPSHPNHPALLRERVSALGLDGRVVFLGQRDDAIELLAGADVVVVPTVTDARGMGREGFGLVAVEAMAVGTPVVGYTGGALGEVLGSCGVLVTEGDEVALAKAVLEAVQEGDGWSERVAAGRERATTRFGEAAMVAGLVACYREAAST